jgi:hypothetical protein
VKARLYVAALLVLTAGLAAGIMLYAMGEDAGDDAGASYVIVGGVAYPVAAQSQKTYVRDLRRFGGKAAVLFDDFDRWFAGLWHGRTLGLTVASLGVALAAALFIVGRYGV